MTKIRAGSKVRISIPKRTALGALHEEEGASRRRVVTVVDPMPGTGNPLVHLGWAGQHEIPAAWIKEVVSAFRFTPESIRDELTDRIEQGWTNDRIVAAYGEDTGPNLRQWLTNRRRKLRKFWDSF
jgi:hypothetical protein